MNKETVLIVGASGKVGSELARLLKSEGLNVRTATSRVPTEPGQVRLNLATGEGLREAFEGVDKAFLLAPPGYADQHALLSPLIQEAKRRGLKKTVLMTAMGANAVETSPFRRAEIELEKSGLAYNIIRPNWFLQNFNTFWIDGILKSGEILVPAGTAKTSFIDARDISAVAAKLLTGNFPSGDLDLTGPEALTHDDVAAAISAVTGKKISYRDIPPAEFKRTFLDLGVPAVYVDFLVTIFGFLREGYNARTTTAIRDILGREPRNLSDYVGDFKAAWL